MLQEEEEIRDQRPDGPSNAPDNTPPEQPAAPAPQAQASAEAPQYSGFGELIRQQQDRLDQRQQRVDELSNRYHQQLERGRSLMSTFLERNKPVYDQAREDRLRKGAMIMALGNILSAAFGMAAGYKGANYAPPINSNGILPILDEMNRMRQEYERRGQRWQDLQLGAQQREQTELAEESRRAWEREQALLDRDRQRLEQLEVAREQGRLSWEQEQERQRLANEAAETAHQRRMEEIRERGAQNRLTSGVRASARQKRKEIPRMYELGRLLGIIAEDPITYSTREVVDPHTGQTRTERVGTRYESMDDEQKAAFLMAQPNLAALYRMVEYYYEQGLSSDRIVDIIQNDMREAGYTTYEEFINGQ